MSNSIFSAKQIARETLPRLMDNLVFPNLIYKDLGDHQNAKKGDTVVIRRPVKLTANDFYNGDTITPQSIIEETVEVPLTTIATVDVEVSALESACSFDDMTRLFLEPAAAALAQKINSDGMMLCYTAATAVGTPGTPPSNLNDFAEAVYALDKAGVPTDNRCAIWSPRTACQLKQIPALVNADQCGSSKALRTGSIGKIFGLENYMSQAVITHTAGSLAGVSANIVVTTLSGEYLTLTCSSAPNKTINPGDVLKLTKKDGSVVYVTAADAVDFNKTSVTLPIVPTSISDVINASVEVMPSHEANMIFHPNAFAFVSRPLAAPAGVESYVTTHNGLSLRVVRGYDINRKKDILSMDVLYSFMPLYPELAIRYMG